MQPDAPNSGAYYAKLMQAAETQGRICFCPADPLLEVVTAWDLGIGDSTAIWFVQQLRSPGKLRVIDHLEASGVGLDWYARNRQARAPLSRASVAARCSGRELSTRQRAAMMLREAKIRRIRACCPAGRCR